MGRHHHASAIFSIARQKPGARRESGRQRAMAATVLSGGMLAALLIATPALAQQGGAGGFEAGDQRGNGVARVLAIFEIRSGKMLRMFRSGSV